MFYITSILMSTYYLSMLVGQLCVSTLVSYLFVPTATGRFLCVRLLWTRKEGLIRTFLLYSKRKVKVCKRAWLCTFLSQLSKQPYNKGVKRANKLIFVRPSVAKYA